MLPRPSGIVSLLTDYGSRDPYAGILRGTVLQKAPKATVVDLGHDITPCDVEEGAFHVLTTMHSLPVGTVHVCVVDPAVGTAQAHLAVATGHGYWLGPDNGLLSPVLAVPGAEVRRLDLEHLQLRPASRTFHGRDVYAPVAGWLAAGRYGFSALGPRHEAPVRLVHGGEPGRVLHVDRFGNLITGWPAERLDGVVGVRLGGQRVPLRSTFAEVAVGAPLALIGSFGLLEVAVHRGSAAAHFGIGRGAAVELLQGGMA